MSGGLDVLTFGESMVSFRTDGPLSQGCLQTTRLAGAESNLAIGLARLGHRVAWAGRVGADRFGELVLRPAAGGGGGHRVCRGRRRARHRADVRRAAHRGPDPRGVPAHRLGRFCPAHRRRPGRPQRGAQGAAPHRDHPRPLGVRTCLRGVGGRERRRGRDPRLPRRQPPQPAVVPRGGPRRAHPPRRTRPPGHRLRRRARPRGGRVRVARGRQPPGPGRAAGRRQARCARRHRAHWPTAGWTCPPSRSPRSTRSGPGTPSAPASSRACSTVSTPRAASSGPSPQALSPSPPEVTGRGPPRGPSFPCSGPTPPGQPCADRARATAPAPRSSDHTADRNRRPTRKAPREDR